LSDRLAALRGVLADHELDAILITHPNNRFYLSGYTGEDDPPNESAGALLISRDRAILYTGSNEFEWAASEAKGFETVAWKRPWASTVAKGIQELGAKRLGFEEEAILFSTMESFKQQLDGRVSFEPVGGKVSALRAIKGDDEVELLERALKITDEAFVACTSDLKPETTERQLAWSIERTMRELGADGIAFSTIVASGPHAARPHHNPTDRAFADGEPIIIDMGAKVGGYNGDLTRTVWIGEPTAKLKDVYNAVWDAQYAALDGVKAGLTGKDADALARDVIAASGYGDFFTHGLGHGLGVRVHEAPSASQTSSGILQPRQVLTIEPGIYISGWGGVRLEDVVLIGEHESRNLTGAPKRPRFNS
jgi:Xaa-Pro aminopeptidase